MAAGIGEAYEHGMMIDAEQMRKAARRRRLEFEDTHCHDCNEPLNPKDAAETLVCADGSKTHYCAKCV